MFQDRIGQPVLNILKYCKLTMPITPNESEAIKKNTTNPGRTPLLTRLWRVWGENAQILLVAMLLAFFIRTFIAEPRFIPSASMLPTLQLGDRLVIEKISYRLHPPQRLDIAVFLPPQQLQGNYDPDQAFIKRVIGVPGDRIAIQQGHVYINDQLLTETYLATGAELQDLPLTTVPPNELFMMGDNRNNSNDSRYWGFLPLKNVIGKAVFRFFPIDRLGGL
jgi:signal peptidase I